MRAVAVIMLFGAATAAWAGQTNSTLHVSATILPAACPAGETAPSCAPFTKSTVVVSSYVVAGPAAGDGSMLTTQKVEGELQIVTLSY